MEKIEMAIKISFNLTLKLYYPLQKDYV